MIKVVRITEKEKKYLVHQKCRHNKMIEQRIHMFE